MARPCGCSGECGCTYIGVDGIIVTGTGTALNPGRIGLSNPVAGTGCDAIFSCISARLGPGMRYNPTTKQLSAAISADGGNTLTYGTDNGLYTSGGGTGTDSYATVAGLIAQTNPVVGGSYGAGLSMHPEGDITPYRVGMDMELPLLHVPVRRTREYFLVAQHYRDLGNYNPTFSGEITTNQDLAMLQRTWYQPGGAPTGDGFNPTFAPQAGYFGFATRDSRRAPLLSDVFNATQRRCVLYLECKDIGIGASDTPSPSDTINELITLITRYGLTKSVIVGIEFPATATTADNASILAGIANLRAAGIATAASLTSDEMVGRITPANMTTNGMTWAMITYTEADSFPAKVKAYKDAGIQVMLTGCHRQYHYNLVINTALFGTGGLKGILAYDPIYAAGITTLYRYRTAAATWTWGTPDYGRHSGWSATIPGQRDRFRGYVLDGQPGAICLDGDVLNVNDTNPSFRPSAYYILQGEQCPVPLNAATGKYDSYDLDVGFIWDGLITDRTRWMGIWFGNTEDRSLLEFTQATQYTRGYEFELSQAGDFSVYRYDGIPYTADPAFQYTLAWPSGWGTITPGTEYRIKVRVRPDRIILGRGDQVEGGTNTRTFNAGTGGGTTWRGGYVYLGRHFFNSPDSTRVRFKNFIVTPI